MNEIKLVVGKAYKDREGDVVKIVSYDKNSTYPFNDVYLENGSYWEDETECDWDLVEEVTEEVMTKQEALDKIEELKSYVKDLDNKDLVEILDDGKWKGQHTQLFSNYRNCFVEISGNSLPEYDRGLYRYYAPIEGKNLSWIRRVKK